MTAANWAALGILYNTGQDCTAGSRVYVQDTIYDKFLQILIGKAKELNIGDGFNEKSGGGPVVRTIVVLFAIIFSVLYGRPSSVMAISSSLFAPNPLALS